MKDYKRLTVRRSFGVIDNCANCPNINNKQGCTDKKCYEIMKNRLCRLEDKIESGELCDRKETAKEIFSYLYSIMVNANFVTGNAEISMWALKNKAAEYGIDFFNNK